MNLDRATPEQQQAILDAVTAALGATRTRGADDGWSGWQSVALPETMPDGNVVQLGLFLHYHADRKGDYLSVSMDWPRDARGNVTTGRDAEYKAGNPEIRVAATKAAAVIARDIRRRLLPEGARLFVLAAARIKSADEYAAKVAANWQAIADAAGSKVRGSRGDHYDVPFLPEGVSVRYVNADSIRLELDLTVAEACAIIAARLPKAKPQPLETLV